MKRNLGFTLIELVIVIAIVGILAAIALPAYSDYVGRSQVIEGFNLVNGLQNEVDIWHNENGVFPDATAVAPTGFIGGMAYELEGKYIQNNGITVTADTGVINVPFDDGVNATKVLRMVPTVTADKIITWSCTGTLESGRLPSSCQ